MPRAAKTMAEREDGWAPDACAQAARRWTKVDKERENGDDRWSGLRVQTVDGENGLKRIVWEHSGERLQAARPVKRKAVQPAPQDSGADTGVFVMGALNEARKRAERRGLLDETQEQREHREQREATLRESRTQDAPGMPGAVDAGRRLRKARAARGLTQKEASKVCGMGRSAYHEHEVGNRGKASTERMIALLARG